ncbi:hypothetical protein [Halohasta litorea]|uniref:Uncharacterized protein n=1 Tax=Halohasta litorea TaxID=869891 RepID=A0ABD6DDJ6_9EURY|nr:hypothetical protein [Halohasta litorea]
MRQRFALILLVAVVLLPMWFVAGQGEPPAETVEIDQSVTNIQPLEGFVDTPTKLSPSQVGVVVWVALFALLGVLAFFHRFMNELARPESDTPPTAADGGTVGFEWMETEERWIVGYDPPSDSLAGLIAMGGLTVLSIVFAALFTGEYLTLARTQYFGIYAFGMFMSLTGLTVSYYAWFMPHIEVAERRGH